MGNLWKITVLIIGMVSMAGCSQNPKFQRYTSKDAGIDVTFDRVEGWLASEQPGSFGSFSQVVFTEPKRPEKALPAIMVLTVQKEGKAKFMPRTEAGAFEDLMARRRHFKEMKVVSVSKVPVLGEQAETRELTYQLLERINSGTGKTVPVKEKVVIFKKGGCFY